MRMPFLHRTRLFAAAAWLPLAFSMAQPVHAADAVVEPQVDRRDVKLPKFPSSDFEVGLYGGAYSTQNFGSSFAGGARLAYHITEDFFVEGAAGRTKVSDEAFRRILPGGIFTGNTETLIYSNLNFGVNVLPGEVFAWGYAMPSQIFLLAGGGTTRFNGQRMSTFDLGVGYKVYLKDWLAVRVDMRDNVYTLDLLGKSDRTQNIELNAGLSFLF